MPNLHDVSVQYGVFLALKSQQSLLPQRRMSFVLNEVFVVTDFGADEMILQVRVNCAGGVLRVGSARNRPCAAFLFAQRGFKVWVLEGGLKNAERT